MHLKTIKQSANYVFAALRICGETLGGVPNGNDTLRDLEMATVLLDC